MKRDYSIGTILAASMIAAGVIGAYMSRDSRTEVERVRAAGMGAGLQSGLEMAVEETPVAYEVVRDSESGIPIGTRNIR